MFNRKMFTRKPLAFFTILLSTPLILAACDNTSGGTPASNVQAAAQQAPAKAPVPAAPTPQKAPDPALDIVHPVTPQQPVDPAAFIVKVDPTEVDFGEIPTGDVGAKMIKLINTGDKPMTITRSQVSCGCTALDLAPNTVLGPKEVKEVKVQLNGGATAGPLHGKKVTFFVEGQPELELPLKATAVSFVTQEPATITPEADKEGKIVLKSRDGSSFRILSMQPPLITEFPPEAKPEHEVKIDWDKYRETPGGITRKVIFYFDHPKCQSLMANIQFTPEELAAAQEKMRQEGIKNGQAGQQPPVVTQQPLDPNALLEQWIQQGQNDQVLKKIAEGTDVNTRNAQGKSLLSMSAEAGNIDLIKALLNAKANVDSTDNSGRTPLMYAAKSKNTEAVRTLLDHGASVSAKDTIGFTALSWACGFSNVDTVKELLDAGADVNVVGQVTGWTPLIWASGFGDPAAIPLLAKLGADVEVPDYIEGATPMIHAARTGKVEGLQALLKAGAKLETPDHNGDTPLLSAAKNSGGDGPKVKTLLDAGANVHAKDNRGLNALQLARKRTDPRAPEVIKLLEPLLAAETPADTPTPAAADASKTPAGASSAAPPAAADKPAANANGATGANGGKTGS